MKGILKELGNFRHLKEFRVDSMGNYKVGDALEVNQFNEGDKVAVSGLNKGRGFQGVVKGMVLAAVRKLMARKSSARARFYRRNCSAKEL